jgi:hypothetical protein
MLAWSGCPQPFRSRRDREFESVFPHQRVGRAPNFPRASCRRPISRAIRNTPKPSMLTPTPSCLLHRPPRREVHSYSRLRSPDPRPGGVGPPDPRPDYAIRDAQRGGADPDTALISAVPGWQVETAEGILVQGGFVVPRSLRRFGEGYHAAHRSFRAMCDCSPALNDRDAQQRCCRSAARQCGVATLCPVIALDAGSSTLRPAPVRESRVTATTPKASPGCATGRSPGLSRDDNFAPLG